MASQEYGVPFKKEAGQESDPWTESDNQARRRYFRVKLKM